MAIEHDDYCTRNDEQRKRLIDLGASLGPEQWTTRLANGWTVAMVYGHLGFWDWISLALIDRYECDGVAPMRVDYKLLNDVLATLFEKLDPDQCYAWAVAAAEAIDSRIRSLPSATAAEIVEKDNPRRLSRHLHRQHHLDAVDQSLRRG